MSSRAIRPLAQAQLTREPLGRRRRLISGDNLASQGSGSLLPAEVEAIRRCLEGDRDAFRLLVERYRDVLYGTAYLMTRNHAYAEEALQEAFLRAWRGLGGFRGGSLKAWLVRILVNRVISQGRRKALDSIPLEEAPEPPASAQAGQDPLVETQRRVEREEVRRALERLPEEQRQVVTLRFFAELSVEETAAALGVRPGTVKSRLFRALERLRELLEAPDVADLQPRARGG